MRMKAKPGQKMRRS